MQFLGEGSARKSDSPRKPNPVSLAFIMRGTQSPNGRSVSVFRVQYLGRRGEIPREGVVLSHVDEPVEIGWSCRWYPTPPGAVRGRLLRRPSKLVACQEFPCVNIHMREYRVENTNTTTTTATTTRRLFFSRWPHRPTSVASVQDLAASCDGWWRQLR